MPNPPAPLRPAVAAPPRVNPAQVLSPDVVLAFAAEFLTSCGTNFLQVGIFFYTQQRFGWTLRSNFLLAAVQGVAYVVGAMNASRVRRRWSPHVTLIGIYAAMTVVAMLGALLPYSAVLATLLPLYAGLSALSWPVMESLISTGVQSEVLAGRIALYNLAWSAAGVVVLAANGWVIEHFPGGVFALPAIFHGTSMLLVHLAARGAKLTQQQEWMPPPRRIRPRSPSCCACERPPCGSPGLPCRRPMSSSTA